MSHLLVQNALPCFSFGYFRNERKPFLVLQGGGLLEYRVLDFGPGSATFCVALSKFIVF